MTRPYNAHAHIHASNKLIHRVDVDSTMLWLFYRFGYYFISFHSIPFHVPCTHIRWAHPFSIYTRTHTHNTYCIRSLCVMRTLKYICILYLLWYGFPLMFYPNYTSSLTPHFNFGISLCVCLIREEKKNKQKREWQDDGSDDNDDEKNFHLSFGMHRVCVCVCRNIPHHPFIWQGKWSTDRPTNSNTNIINIL